MTTFTRYDGETYGVEVGDTVHLMGGGYHDSAGYRDGIVEKIGRTRVHISAPVFHSAKPVQFSGEDQSECTDRPSAWWFRTSDQRVDEERRLAAIAKLRTVGLSLMHGRCPTDLLVKLADLVPDPDVP